MSEQSHEPNASAEALPEGINSAFQDYQNALKDPQYAEHLVNAYRAYTTTEAFSPGDLVQWKPQLRDRLFPEYGAPAVVVRYLDEPDSHDADGDRKPALDDLVVGVLDSDHNLQLLIVNSHRFTSWSKAD